VILAGDIGGTKVNLACFDGESARLLADKLSTYPSHEYPNLLEMVRRFLADHQVQPQYACFGMAGPVRKDRVRLTNLPWVVDARELERALHLKQVWLLNDLQANAHGIPALGKEDFVVLNRGEEDSSGNAAIVAAGTGLGEAGLVWDGNRHLPVATEGGHSLFAPRTDLDVELFRHLRDRFGRVSWERVLSGPGFVNIYEFLRGTGRGQEPGWLREEFRTTDPAVAVTRAALAGTSPLAVQTLELFVQYYGTEASNVALQMLATGGVYVGGGIAPKIISKLRDGTFLRAFIGDGRMKELLTNIPVRVILNDKTPLLGAARYAALQSGRKIL
jgi:glucokinase